ncbi:MAG: class I SAM-dependent methyltransferase [Nitrospinota bacterium]|nr:class I SAM-dependent methyltransferase [Nitrospinota bacterium]
MPAGSVVCHFGAGRYSLKICPRLSGSRIIRVDVDIPGLRSNTGRCRVAADGVALPFRDYLFDVVMADNVLEHLEHPQAVLQEIARSLKPDGAFVFL